MGKIWNISTITETYFSAFNFTSYDVFRLSFTFKTVHFNAFRIFIDFQPKIVKHGVTKAQFINFFILMETTNVWRMRYQSSRRYLPSFFEQLRKSKRGQKLPPPRAGHLLRGRGVTSPTPQKVLNYGVFPNNCDSFLCVQLESAHRLKTVS